MAYGGAVKLAADVVVQTGEGRSLLALAPGGGGDDGLEAEAEHLRSGGGGDGREPLDVRRCLPFALFGAVYVGVFQTLLYSHIMPGWPSRAARARARR